MPVVLPPCGCRPAGSPLQSRSGSKHYVHYAKDNLLQRLAGQPAPGEEIEMWAALAATQPKHAAKPKPRRQSRRREKSRAARRGQALGDAPADQPDYAAAGQDRTGAVKPIEPTSFRSSPNSFAEAELSDSQVEALILKFLLARGDASGRASADHIRLPFRLDRRALPDAQAGPARRSQGRRPDERLQLRAVRPRPRAGAPVRRALHLFRLRAGLARATTSSASRPRRSPISIRPKTTCTHAFDDLLINPKMLGRLGPAINSGRGMFLYGSRATEKRASPSGSRGRSATYIWIPRAIGVDGEIIRLFDPCNHESAPRSRSRACWIKARSTAAGSASVRPTIVVGGELTMNMLEVQHSVSTGIGEAPLQMKSNCGTLVIDDFGRQRMSTDELLNRWIVPLEKRYDYLNLPGGKKIQVPFDQLIIFSTNLEPRDLVDDAFLRRIPYKIEITDPSEDEFRKLFVMMAPKFGIELREGAAELPHRKALPGGPPAVPLLPAPRPALANPELLPVQQRHRRNDQRQRWTSPSKTTSRSWNEARRGGGREAGDSHAPSPRGNVRLRDKDLP